MRQEKQLNEKTTDIEKQKIINCHTHIFTGDHVPSYLAKTFLPWPFYYLISLSFIVKLFRAWFKGPYRLQFKPAYKVLVRKIYQVKIFVYRSKILSTLRLIIGLWLTIESFFIIVDALSRINSLNEDIINRVAQAYIWLNQYHLVFIPHELFWRIAIIFGVLLFFKTGRNLLFFVLSKIWSLLSVLPGKRSKELAQRYINLGRFAFYDNQSNIFSKLQGQYPEGTGFVLLPMDMEYMEAGRLKKGARYADQMQQLAAIKKNNKNTAYPFVFAEPRRMAHEGKEHFDYEVADGKVILKECFIKDYIEKRGFSGFKIYPALGYYPFDETLLPLWKYAADAGLPILTHCIRGTIFYRGQKKKEWDYHPLFQESIGSKDYRALLLPEIKNSEYINNFTHPLNYLCLLDPELLVQLVAKAKDKAIWKVFGYDPTTGSMEQNLSHLKLCFGHFGGDDEWGKFLESDRDIYSNQLVRYPMRGINFTKDEDGNPTPGKMEQLWKYTDWYSIICSMMLQYKNVYGDLSYIIHDAAIQPLLKQTLMNPKLREKVLFGTDFYVVRNHKSEKDMLAETLKQLTQQDFDQIARINPSKFI